MTQFRLGVMQQFPAGDSLTLKYQQTQLNGKRFHVLSLERRLQVELAVKERWLSLEYWQRVQSFLAEDQILFKQLIEIVQSLYGVGKASQQNVIRAELELAQLTDKLVNAQLKEQEAVANLSRWIGPGMAEQLLNYGWNSRKTRSE